MVEVTLTEIVSTADNDKTKVYQCNSFYFHREARNIFPFLENVLNIILNKSKRMI
jgi:hypothetical protein